MTPEDTTVKAYKTVIVRSGTATTTGHPAQVEVTAVSGSGNAVWYIPIFPANTGATTITSFRAVDKRTPNQKLRDHLKLQAGKRKQFRW